MEPSHRQRSESLGFMFVGLDLVVPGRSRHLKEGYCTMCMMFVVAMAATNVAQGERTGRRQAAADLFLGEGDFWPEFGWQRIAGRTRFSQTFGEHADLCRGNQRYG